MLSFRRCLSALFPALALAVLFVIGARVAVAGSPLLGTSALQGASPKVRAALLAMPTRDPHVVRLDMWEYVPGSTRVVRAYDTSMTQKLHLIGISDDLTTFLHIHPVLGPDGHFRVEMHAPASGLYHLYADGDPQGYGHTVFRFDLPVGAGAHPTPPRLGPSAQSMTVGPYTVSLNSLVLDPDHLTMLIAHVQKNGAPANDLHPYLGAIAHVVLINTRDLTYVHTHPMDLNAMNGMGSMSSSDMPGMTDEMAPMSPTARVAPDMMLHVTAHEPGTYKLWLQFRGGSQLYVVPFVLNARAKA